MRITERKLRRVIRSVISESQDGAMPSNKVMAAENCLIELVNTGAVGFGSNFDGPIHFSKVYEMCESDGVSVDDVLTAIDDNPSDYEIRGCMVYFLRANKLDTITPEHEKLMKDLNPSTPYSYGQR